MANSKWQIANSKSKNRLIFLVGPTAVGKTEVALSLAKKLNAEIISCDSMQIYKGMDVLTSMPSPSARKKIPHHLIRFLNPNKEYNVSKYRSHALKKAKEIIKRGKIPLFVGGTGHYMSILIDGLFPAKAPNKSIRNKLYKEAREKGKQCLYGRLKKIDPQAADKIHPHDLKRIVRALEVFETMGKPISELQKQRKGLEDEFEVKVFCLNMPRNKLYQRINSRLDQMFRQGLFSEVKRLLKRRLSKTAAYAIGIPEITSYFNGRYSLEEAKRLIKGNSRLYAKRQLTWFRKDKRIEWVEVEDKKTPTSTASKILKRLEKGAPA